jgi:hypothetical protein
MTTIFATADLTDTEQPSRGHVPTPAKSRALKLFERFCEQKANDPDIGPIIAVMITPGHPGASVARTQIDGAFTEWEQHLLFVAAGGERGVVVECGGE